MRYVSNRRCVECGKYEQEIYKRPMLTRQMIAERTANGELYTKL